MTIDRKAFWETVYTGKDPLEMSWFQKEPVLSLQLIQDAGLDTSAPLIDVGGGASVLVDRLLDKGYSRVEVLDISAQAIDQTRQRLGPQSADVTWHVADITQFIPEQRYQLWHDRAVFHFLTDAEDRRRYVAALRTGLAPGGHLIMAAFAIGGPERCSGLDIVQYDAEKLLGELGDGFRLIEEMQEEHHTPTGKNQLFAYFHLIYEA